MDDVWEFAEKGGISYIISVIFWPCLLVLVTEIEERELA